MFRTYNLAPIPIPYPQHRSALTDCVKLSNSGFPDPKAIVIIGYSYPDMPLGPAIQAFEILANANVRLGPRCEASFSHLCHPVHQEGKVIAWLVQ